MPCLETLSEQELTSCFNYAQLVKAIAKRKAELIPTELKDLQEEEGVALCPPKVRNIRKSGPAEKISVEKAQSGVRNLHESSVPQLQFRTPYRTSNKG
jgi:hypothetical protein